MSARALRVLALAASFAVSALVPAAAPRAEGSGLDTSKPLRCALAEASDCDEAAVCSEVELAQIEIPDTLKVDFAAKQLASPGGERTSPISSVETSDAVLVVQGHQNGRGWTAVVDRATGRLAATLTDAEGSFVLAGGCVAE